MAVLANRAKMTTATVGTGTVTLGSAVAGFQTFADAGVATGESVSYLITEGSNWEVGRGTYTTAGTTLTRGVLESNNADAAITLAGAAIVTIVALKEDLASAVATWTPVLTFATPGNLSVAYTTQVGRYVVTGRMVEVYGSIITSTFTHTTASGDLQITGLPFTSANITGLAWFGAINPGGITKAGYTSFVVRVSANVALARVAASGSGVATATIAAADMPTGGTVVLQFSLRYLI